MNLITNSEELVKTFKTLCSRYSHYKWAVAWAGDTHSFNLAKFLNKYEAKVEQLVVGLHFYQTSPEFIEAYMSNHHVRFYMQSDGTFHSKMYLFYNNESDWEAIVGSSNFTDSGFNHNLEANILFGAQDGKQMFYQMDDYISSIWDNGEYFDKKKLSIYEQSLQQQQKKLHSLKKLMNKHDSSISSQLELMTWEEYTNLVLSQDREMIDVRMSLLQRAYELFSSVSSFNELYPGEQNALAGLSSKLEDDGIDWQFFGSTTAKGDFWSFVSSGELGRAIDIIPLKGTVSRKQYEDYCAVFYKKYQGNPIALATRLLAIKRPDFFIGINGKNKHQLSLFLSVPQSHFTLERYWDEILEKLHNSVWYSEKAKRATITEMRLFGFRMAMLDTICYNE